MKTPLTDAAEKRSAHPQFIFIEDARTLETAARGLRDAAEAYIEARNTVDSTDRDSRNYQPSLRDARKAWMEYKIKLARFDALKEGK